MIEPAICPECHRRVSSCRNRLQIHLRTHEEEGILKPWQPQPERYLCLHPTCPVATTHASGKCQYHGKRGPFAEVHAQRSHMERL